MEESTYHPRADLLALVKGPKDRCWHCGSRGNLTIDHKNPLPAGSWDDPDNLQVLCWSCNSAKGNSPIELFGLTYHCQRCTYDWQPRKPLPSQCPRCKSPSWNKPRAEWPHVKTEEEPR